MGPYLRSFPADVLQARPSYQILQTFSLLSTVLREAPFISVSSTRAAGGGGDVLLAMVMPLALNKKELTKGVLSGNSLLQVRLLGGGCTGAGQARGGMLLFVLCGWCNVKLCLLLFSLVFLLLLFLNCYRFHF